MNKLLSEKIVFNNWFNVEEASIETDTATISRMRLNRPDASAVLVYNRDSQKFILTKQFRYAILANVSEDILETVAGKIDPGESPEQAAVRECREEIGYRITPQSLELVSSCFASPGYTSEILHLYYAETGNADKVDEGGGLKSEDEDITIVEMPRDELFQKVKNRELNDAKTILIVLWLLATRH